MAVAKPDGETFHPTLVLVGTRLGIDKINQVYWEALTATLQMPQSVGIAGYVTISWFLPAPLSLTLYSNNFSLFSLTLVHLFSYIILHIPGCGFSLNGQTFLKLLSKVSAADEEYVKVAVHRRRITLLAHNAQEMTMSQDHAFSISTHIAPDLLCRFMKM